MKKNSLKLILLMLGLMWFQPSPVFCQQNIPDPDMWTTNGTVYTIACTENTTYIGGRFQDVGKNTGYGVPLNISTGEIMSSFPIVNDNVYAAVSDGNGGWFIGGGFSSVGGAERNKLAHILPDARLAS
jgi:hypothetical protein